LVFIGPYFEAFAGVFFTDSTAGRSISGWLRSKAGDSDRILGIDVKLWRGGGHDVAHSRDRP
jgi:hypothetical protein